MNSKNLDALFNPKNVALIGASTTPNSVGYSLVENLTAGFGGDVFLINPKHKLIKGRKTYSSILDVPKKIDLAIIATPAKTVPELVTECGEVGVKSIIIISAGFKEAGKEGREREQHIKDIAQAYDMRVLGPNCLGFLHPAKKLNASFCPNLPKKGSIAFLSQSGAMGTAILDWAVEKNIGFRYFVSLGEMVDIGFDDLIDYFGQDPNTSSILIYMESLTHARKFMSAARGFALSKPIMVLKAGKSAAGSKAALSHTGSLAGDDAGFKAAFKRSGIIRVDSIGELFDCAQTLALQPLPKNSRLAIVTNAGGPGVIATDCLMENQGKLAALTQKTKRTLDALLPRSWSKNNPVDILGDATPERYQKTVKTVLQDENVDGILVLLTPQAMTSPLKVAQHLSKLSKHSNKPVMACWMGGKEIHQGKQYLEQHGIPVYETPEDAIICFLHLHNYAKNLALLYETPSNTPSRFNPNYKAAKNVMRQAFREGRDRLSYGESKEVLHQYGIPVVKGITVCSPEQAAEDAAKIGFPVVMKVNSSAILHKTEKGGIRLNVNSQKEVKKAFNDLMGVAKKAGKGAMTSGVVIEPFVHKKFELLIGAKKDPVFGPVILFGMGGVGVETFKDINAGLPPLTMALAQRVIEQTKVYSLLKGIRGLKGVNLRTLQFILYKFSYFLMDFPEVKEVDINPFMMDQHGGLAVDARILLEKASMKHRTLYSHLVISPYPKEHVSKFIMRNGKQVILRPIKPEDEPLHAEFLKKLSPTTQRLAFFHLVKKVTHQLLVRYTNIDYDREIAIMAELSEKTGKKMVGVARLMADPYNETAKFAIVVGDPWQHQGLGTKLTDYLLSIARERNLKLVTAEILGTDKVMSSLLEKRGFITIKKSKTNILELKL